MLFSDFSYQNDLYILSHTACDFRNSIGNGIRRLYISYQRDKGSARYSADAINDRSDLLMDQAESVVDAFGYLSGLDLDQILAVGMKTLTWSEM